MSTKKEYTVEQPYELTTTPISWLDSMPREDLVGLSADDILFVVSQPNFQVQDTHYISKKLTLGTFKQALSTILSVDVVQSEIDQINTTIEQIIDLSNDLSAVSEGVVVINDLTGSQQMQIDDPYIVSSIAFGNGNLSALSGYSLKNALSAIVPYNQYSNGTFEALSCTTLNVNGHSVSSIAPATSADYGTVKAYSISDDIQDTPDDLYIRTNRAGILYASKTSLGNILSSMVAQLSNDITRNISVALSKQFFKTQVVDGDIPAMLVPNTIYYHVAQ